MAAVAQDLAIGLEGVAAAGGCHQHGIERFNVTSLFEVLHQVLRQLPGLLHLPLVMASGSAATLIFWNHDLEAVGLQHGNRGGIHLGVKAALHTAEH